ncbi:hypothetical protein EHR08_13370 [Leptospira bandrabouensis]|uniref:Uncharacterized protein n=1 Tax=Leptospira bandrabouensis TaxID=2484903 RepID=A0A6H3NLX1_9LEPT|nr:hypothetical protein EHR07_00420 [Leptospira bandrabouensis]TGN12366.1 hypothetical protein EHR08_13370 [Leptospira bandrabouensis]
MKKQAIEIQKETNALIDKIKDHPLEVLSHLGIDIDELAEKRIWEKIQYEQMTDEERETYEAKQKLKYYEEQENVRRQQEEYHRNQQAKQFHLEQFNKQILTEIEKNNLPKDTSTYKKFVVIVQKAIQNQLPVTFADIAQLVKEDLEKEDRRLVERYKKKDVNSLIEELGEETIKAIQQEQIKKLKNPYVTTVNPTKGTMTKIKKGKGSLDDWFNGLNNGY